MTASRIIGTGHYLPPKVVTNFDVMEIMETTDEYIVERTGGRRRRQVGDAGGVRIGLRVGIVVAEDVGSRVALLACPAVWAGLHWQL